MSRDDLRDAIAQADHDWHQLREMSTHPSSHADFIIARIANHYHGATHIDLSDWSGVVATNSDFAVDHPDGTFCPDPHTSPRRLWEDRYPTHDRAILRPLPPKETP